MLVYFVKKEKKGPHAHRVFFASKIWASWQLLNKCYTFAIPMSVYAKGKCAAVTNIYACMKKICSCKMDLSNCKHALLLQKYFFSSSKQHVCMHECTGAHAAGFFFFLNTEWTHPNRHNLKI